MCTKAVHKITFPAPALVCDATKRTRTAIVLKKRFVSKSEPGFNSFFAQKKREHDERKI